MKRLPKRRFPVLRCLAGCVILRKIDSIDEGQMRKRSSILRLMETAAIVLAAAIAAPTSAAADETAASTDGSGGGDAPSIASSDTRFLTLGTLGDVGWAEGTSSGRFHVTGHVSVNSSDYALGAYDNVPQTFARLSPEFDLLGSLELFRSESGPVSSFSLIAGVDDNFADTPSPKVNDGWYEDNLFAGAAVAFAPGFVAGVTYSWLGTVRDDQHTAFAQEIVAAVRYTGDGGDGGDGFAGSLKPQLKAGTVVNGDGSFFSAAIGPSFKPWENASVSLSVPIEIGVGIDDYYGKGTGTGFYGSTGLYASLPLKSVPDALGKWTLKGGGKLILRDHTIVAAGQPFDDAGTAAFLGTVSLSFAF